MAESHVGVEQRDEVLNLLSVIEEHGWAVDGFNIGTETVTKAVGRQEPQMVSLQVNVNLRKDV